MARITGRSLRDVEASLPWPTDTFRERASIDLGNRSVELIATPGHSPDSVCVFVRDCGVLFGGDTVVTCIPPVFRDGSSRQLEDTLATLAREPGISTIVPGHGSLAEGEGVMETLQWAQSYIHSLRCAVSLLMPAAERTLLGSLTYDKYIGERFDRDLYRMQWRHELTIRSLLAEGRP